jgi:hypothetical protein
VCSALARYEHVIRVNDQVTTVINDRTLRLGVPSAALSSMLGRQRGVLTDAA